MQSCTCCSFPRLGTALLSGEVVLVDPVQIQVSFAPLGNKWTFGHAYPFVDILLGH
jgi:hypothetical protein